MPRRFALSAALIALAGAGISGGPAWAGAHPAAEAQALELAKAFISYRSVAGEGNQTPALDAYVKDVLIKGGFDAADISITPVDDTAFLIARWQGSDPSLKPLVISGHLDVVEAKPQDWERDPFKAVVEDGKLFGRGASDMKADAALAVATVIDMKKSGYKPRRTIVLEFSGDEETTMKTSAMIADKLAGAEMVLNLDGGGGVLDEKTGKQLFFTWQGAEKTYADYQLTVTNAGGHSSQPRKDNAINQLSAALLRIGGYQFKPELNPITKEMFEQASKYWDPAVAPAMRAFAANPADKQAIATLSSVPALVGLIGTTCVTTMISGGHALNALPQRATANINCRIFPGHSRADIMAELAKVANDPEITFSDVTAGSVATAPSPIRADLVDAVQTALAKSYPGVPMFASQASGASDNMWFRAKGVPSYGASPIFSKPSEEFSHGLNERVPVANFAPAIVYYESLLTTLTK